MKYIIAYNARSNGLGNRLRVTLAARNLAEATGRRLLVVWPTSRAFQPRFRDLFTDKVGTRFPLSASQLLSKVFRYRDEHLTDIRKDDRDLIWQIRTGAGLQLPEGVDHWEDDLRALTPIPEIVDRVQTTYAQFDGQPFVGVQVRSAHIIHQKTLDASPLTWFTERLDAIRANHPDLRFFLSCDVAEVTDHLLARYPGSVALQDKGEFNTIRGVQSALCDLYLLASSGHIIGPAYSSFVELAVRLADHRVPFEHAERAVPFDAGRLDCAADPIRPERRRS